MKFEEMQDIWNSQNGEKQLLINESLLHARIKRKSRSVNRLLEMFEWVMIGVNLIIGIVLIMDTVQENKSSYQFVISALYIIYAVYAFVRHMTRRKKEEVRFEHTILGELDKAIWQIDYLIRQGQAMTLWYVLPLVLVVSISLIHSTKSVWVWAFLLLLIPASYFSTRWEANKWYLPKKRVLESLREQLKNGNHEHEHII